MQPTSALLGGQAAPRFIEHNGKRYFCRPFTQRVKSEIERRLEDARRRALLGYGLSNPTPPDVAALLLREHANDTLAGRFAFGGPDHVAWVSTQEGATAVASILFQISEDEATNLLLERGEEVAHLIQATVLESLPPALVARIQAAMKEQQEQGQPVEGVSPNH